MDPINRLNSIMAVLQRQISETGRHARPGYKPTSGQIPSIAPAAPALQELKRKLQKRLSAISPDDGQKDHKSQRLFLESVLAWEFGDGLLQESRFDELVDNIQQALSSNPAVASRIRELMTELAADGQE